MEELEVVFFAVPCKHEAAGMPHDGDVPDYEPLTLDQVAALLDAASSAGARGDWRTANRLHVRLSRALPGSTCPRQVDGPVAERETRLGSLFVDRYREGGTPELTGAVRAVLAEGPADGGADTAAGPGGVRE
jgi:hypothetical protein